MSEFSEFRPGPLPEDKDIPQEQIDAAPQVQIADKIISKVEAEFDAQDARRAEKEKMREERKSLAAISIEEVPKFVSDSVAKTEAMIQELEQQVAEHPENSVLSQRLETARVYLQDMNHVNTVISQYADSTTEKDLQRFGRLVFNRRRNIEEFLTEPTIPERWPGQKVHETTPAEAAPGSYEQAIHGLEGKPDDLNEFNEHIDPDEYDSAISAAVNEIHRQFNELDVPTASQESDRAKAETLRAEAHTIYVGWKKFHDIPTISDERKELEDEQVKQQLHDILWQVDRIAEDFLA